jgi:AraC-like DNA-binding protein
VAELIDAAETYLKDCIGAASSPRASELADRLRLSPVQLAREFRGSVGRTVSSFLKSRQIEVAKLLLETTDLGTQAIAVRAGFGTARTFYRAFRRSTGMTPTDFRRERNVAGRSSVPGLDFGRN